MKRNTAVWRKLYKLSDQLENLKPWKYMTNDDCVCIEFAPDDIVYCIVMGRFGECIAISAYEGENGYADLCSLSCGYEDQVVADYLMLDQKCLTWYIGERNEVPAEQRTIIKNLGLRYRGSHGWPYFISYEPKFCPAPFSEEEAERFVLILERLVDILETYIDGNIDVQFKKDEMIFAHLKDEQWIYESMSLPRMIDKYAPISFTDDKICEELDEQEHTSQKLYVDLIYMDTYIRDEKYKKPVNTLVFIVVDVKTEAIVHADVLKPNDDERNVILTFFISYLLDAGIPQKIYMRNPTVRATLLDICEKYHIALRMGSMEVIDNIIDELHKVI